MRWESNPGPLVLQAKSLTTRPPLLPMLIDSDKLMMQKLKVFEVTPHPDMLTLPLSAEVYRFLSASSAYRFAVQIFRFLYNLPLSNYWLLFTPSDWDWVTVCHHYKVMTAIQEIVKTCVMQSNCISRLPWQVKRQAHRPILNYLSLVSSLPLKVEGWWLYKYWHMF